jgi:predicted chitinase
MANLRLKDFFTFYKGLPHQLAAIQQLQEAIPAELLDRKAAWYETWKAGGKTDTKNWLIKREELAQITGFPARSFNDAFCQDLTDLLVATGFDKHPKATSMLLANLCHESAGFVYMKEIASGIDYEWRADLGNTHEGDGPKFKGCGPLQVTGRGHFLTFYRWLKEHRGIDDPRIISEGTNYVADKYPFLIAVSWINTNHLLDVCLNKGFDSCCQRINGGWNGIDDRHLWYDKCRRVLGV